MYINCIYIVRGNFDIFSICFKSLLDPAGSVCSIMWQLDASGNSVLQGWTGYPAFCNIRYPDVKHFVLQMDWISGVQMLKNLLQRWAGFHIFFQKYPVPGQKIQHPVGYQIKCSARYLIQYPAGYQIQIETGYLNRVSGFSLFPFHPALFSLFFIFALKNIIRNFSQYCGTT